MQLFAQGLQITYKMIPNAEVLEDAETSDEEVECLLAVMIDKVV
jgi:hypothetical protein